MQRRTSISFQHEIVKTQLLKIRQEKWEQMREPTLKDTARNNDNNVIRITIPIGNN
jgi:hypothetical protein